MVLILKTAGSEQDNDDWTPSDTELGVGEETAADAASDATAKIAAAMSDPTIAAAIEQLVQKRVAEMSVANGIVAAPGVDLMAGFKLLAQEMANAINRNANATMEQTPGYVKPIPPEELEKRGAAWVEMQSLLDDTNRRYWDAIERKNRVEAERLAPRYMLQQDFFGPGEVGNDMYVAGETIRWFAAPGTYMEPRNEIAQRLSELAWAYLGNEGAPTADDLKERAMDMIPPSTPGAPVPEMALLMSARSRGRPSTTRVEEAGIADLSPSNITGTVVRITKGGLGHLQTQPIPGGPRQVRGPVQNDGPLV